MFLHTFIRVTTEAIIIATVTALAIPFFVVLAFPFIGM
jgi:hypothetical protein